MADVKNALGHIGFGLILMLPFALVGQALIGWAVQSYYWLGRERRDYEIVAMIDPHREWWMGWNLLRWDKVDLWPPIFVNGAIAWSLTYFKVAL